MPRAPDNDPELTERVRVVRSKSGRARRAATSAEEKELVKAEGVLRARLNGHLDGVGVTREEVVTQLDALDALYEALLNRSGASYTTRSTHGRGRPRLQPGDEK